MLGATALAGYMFLGTLYGKYRTGKAVILRMTVLGTVGISPIQDGLLNRRLRCLSVSTVLSAL